ncbi:MAG TPA: PTS sugar transporter subunit IIB [Gemmatimonadaceae bacterium]|nr:PTS sugar transporter subunit IIB [Gemmatimonadaceae bacterium]
MPIELYRIDDRLIHGQVVVGWGRALNVAFVLLVDDGVAGSEWEQELYRMGTPPEMEVKFESAAAAIKHLGAYQADPRPGLLLTADVETMRRLVEATGTVRQVNLGGLHHRADRAPRLRYVFLSPDEEHALRGLAARGVSVTAQDVPSAAPVPLDELLAGSGA